MYIGIDLGTSAVKAVLVDDAQRVVDQSSAPLEVLRPRPHWSEQDPDAWWQATGAAMGELKKRRKKELSGVKAIGLSGQMHGAVLLGQHDRVLRPAILWNDTRSGAECVELERREPASRRITGNLAMPGFTAPKLIWVARNEPDVFAKVERVLLPKDYLRLLMSGASVSDMSDSAGTLWLDVAGRKWSAAMLAATDLPFSAMPELCEGSDASARLSKEVASAWGLKAGVPIAGGAGDNAAGAVGVGVIEPGSAFLSLGTSGVIFAANDGFRPNPERAVHAFCHCLPGRWHQMSVILSAASCLAWATQVSGAMNEAALLAEAGQSDRLNERLLFLPYLSGERTPHNDPDAMGVLFGITHDVSRADFTRAVLEGVAFAFADGLDALAAAGTAIEELSVIGGGARSPFWGRILASVLERPLIYHRGGDIGPAFGAARLARLAVTDEQPAAVCEKPETDFVVQPNSHLVAFYKTKIEAYRNLYRTVRPAFAPAGRADKPDATQRTRRPR